MRDRLSLLDSKFSHMTVREKRGAFYQMDLSLQKLHSKDYMVADFNPKYIYEEDGIYCFDKIVPISGIYAMNKEDAIRKNLIGLADLAFCSYLQDYNLKNGLLSLDVVSNHFSSFEDRFEEEDRHYYKSILVDAYLNRQLPEGIKYYTDYLNKRNSQVGKGSSMALVKATEAGRAFTDETAFSSNILLVTVATILSIALATIIFYFSLYLR